VFAMGAEHPVASRDILVVPRRYTPDFFHDDRPGTTRCRKPSRHFSNKIVPDDLAGIAIGGVGSRNVSSASLRMQGRIQPCRPPALEALADARRVDAEDAAHIFK